MGPQEWSDGGKCFRTLGTTSVPGAKVSDNQRPIFCTLTIVIRNVGFQDIDISQPTRVTRTSGANGNYCL